MSQAIPSEILNLVFQEFAIVPLVFFLLLSQVKLAGETFSESAEMAEWSKALRTAATSIPEYIPGWCRHEFESHSQLSDIIRD